MLPIWHFDDEESDDGDDDERHFRPQFPVSFR